MKRERVRRALVPRGILLAVVTIVCLLLPTGNNFYTDAYWMNRLFPQGSPAILLVGPRVFLAEPLFWGVLLFFLLGCLDILLPAQTAKLRLPKPARWLLRAIALLLAAGLLYWLTGMALGVVLPPMPVGIGFWLTRHYPLFAILWCLDAVMWQFSLWNAA